MAKREFLQLAHNYDPKKYGIAGWWVSEKLDGMRAFWDGGISRGHMAADIPWANTEKDFRLTTQPVATGLWSRYGKVIHAPDWWLDHLPKFPLDGELYIGRQKFQQLVSVTKRHEAGPEWRNVMYMAFDSPPYEAVFADGEINHPNFKKRFKGILPWMAASKADCFIPPNVGFTGRLKRLRLEIGSGNDVLQVHNQIELPYHTAKAVEALNEFLAEVCDAGGEGVMLKNPGQLWLPERSHALLKYKPWHDAEATVVGYQWGRETDKGSKLLGMMGALILEIKAGRFRLSGFTDEERMMTYVGTETSAYDEGCKHPEEEVAPHIHNPRFPRGSQVTYKFRELTDAGLPKEGRFFRPAPGA